MSIHPVLELAAMHPYTIARMAFYSVVDAVTPRRPFTPPRRLAFLFGAGDFSGVGQEFFGHLVAAGLKPHHRVLDIGCGAGRMAVPLIDYLTKSYDGFDTIRPAVKWCQENITTTHPNFRFTHADIYNKSYNPSGRIAASQFRFPCDDGTVDFAFAVSVFTHMFPGDVEHYLAEVSRVLAPRGVLFSTWFLLNEDALALITAGKSSLPMIHEIDGFRTTNHRTPEYAVGLYESWTRMALSKQGLSCAAINYGSWCGRSGLSYQDILVATPAGHFA